MTLLFCSFAEFGIREIGTRVDVETDGVLFIKSFGHACARVYRTFACAWHLSRCTCGSYINHTPIYKKIVSAFVFSAYTRNTKRFVVYNSIAIPNFTSREIAGTCLYGRRRLELNFRLSRTNIAHVQIAIFRRPRETCSENRKFVSNGRLFVE